MDRVLLEQLLAEGLSLERIGERVGRHPSTVAYWIRSYGLAAVHRDKHAARRIVTRECLEPLVLAGASVGSIASALGVSRTTVRHWLEKFGLETERGRRLRLSREGRASATLPEIVQRECRRHGLTDFRLEGRGLHRCMRCRVEYVARRRQKVRSTLIREAGGCCRLCGYNSFEGALQFHHLDPRTKSFNIRGGTTPSLARLRQEAAKCVLLCANCHAEVEGGVATPPAKVSASPADPREDPG
jgi:transposase